MRRRYVYLGLAIATTYSVFFTLSQWLARSGAVALALTLFVGCGLAVFVLIAHFFRDLLEPRAPRKSEAKADHFMSVVAGDRPVAREKKSGSGANSNSE